MATGILILETATASLAVAPATLPLQAGAGFFISVLGGCMSREDEAQDDDESGAAAPMPAVPLACPLPAAVPPVPLRVAAAPQAEAPGESPAVIPAAAPALDSCDGAAMPPSPALPVSPPAPAAMGAGRVVSIPPGPAEGEKCSILHAPVTPRPGGAEAAVEMTPVQPEAPAAADDRPRPAEEAQDEERLLSDSEAVAPAQAGAPIAPSADNAENPSIAGSTAAPYDVPHRDAGGPGVLSEAIGAPSGGSFRAQTSWPERRPRTEPRTSIAAGPHERHSVPPRAPLAFAARVAADPTLEPLRPAAAEAIAALEPVRRPPPADAPHAAPVAADAGKPGGEGRAEQAGRPGTQPQAGPAPSGAGGPSAPNQPLAASETMTAVRRPATAAAPGARPQSGAPFDEARAGILASAQEPPLKRSPSAAATEAPAAKTVDFEPPARTYTPLRGLTLRLDGPEKIDVRLAERAGGLHVAVHAPESELRRQLQDQLPYLVRGLEHQGYSAETWHPAEPAPRAGAGDRLAQDAPAGGEGGAHQDGRGRRRSPRPEWLEEMGRRAAESERNSWQSPA